MNKLVISAGSNSKDRDWQIESCLDWLKSNFSGVVASSVYNSRAANGKDPDYLNVVIKAKSHLEFSEVNDLLKKYESVCGRTPLSKKIGDVPMDLDIVIWNGDILREKDFNNDYFQIGWTELNS